MACIRITTEAVGMPSLSVPAVPSASISIGSVSQASGEMVPLQQLKLTCSEVCTVAGGTIVVLAASDGPLRTRNGGYFLLNPATNPPE